MSHISADFLKKVAPQVSPQLRAEYLAWFNYYCWKYQINTEKRIAGLFCNVMEETGRLTRTVENLNYSAKRLCQVWPRRFPSIAAALPYANNPRAFANKVYNGRLGNRLNSDDGWNFRGRGGNQTTGRSNYEALGKELGYNLITNPEFLQTPQGLAWSACAEFAKRGCNGMADRSDVTAMCKAINGGTNGLANRKTFFSSCMTWLPDGFKLDQTAQDAAESKLIRVNGEMPPPSEPVPAPDPEIPVAAEGEDEGSPAWVEPFEQENAGALTAPETEGLSSTQPGTENAAGGSTGVTTVVLADGQTATAVPLKKVSTFTKVMTAIGTALSGWLAWIGVNFGNDAIKQQMAEKALNATQDNNQLAAFGIFLAYAVVIVLAAGALLWLVLWFYDKARQSNSKINQTVITGLQDQTKNNVVPANV